MDGDTVAEISEWSAEPFEGGYGGLHRLADREFTGAVEARGSYLFFLNGTAVGVADGTLEGFEGADGTAYEAPHPSLPLLFAMQERGGDTRGRYYTEDTPVTEVDGTLTEAGFTGYLELSENVLSGDYYAVYHGGKSMKLAFVGQARRVFTDGEAWEKTRDEVGIYEVTAVSLDALEIPGEPPADVGETAAAGTLGDQEAAGGGADPLADLPGADSGEGQQGLDESQQEPDESEQEHETAPSAPAEAEPAPEQEPAEDRERAGEPADVEPTVDDTTGASDRPSTEGAATGAPADEEVTAVPSVDPERSADAAGAAPREAHEAPDDDDATVDLVAEVEAELAEREDELAEARRRIEELGDRREELKSQLERVRAERDDRQAELDRVGAAGADAETEMSPPEVRAGTSLFVRYDSKGQTTLEDLLAADGEESGLQENLRIEYHTDFDDTDVVVDGQRVGEFLSGTQEYRFLEWLATDLFFEIRGTGTVEPLATLYEAIPSIDRVELDRSLSVGDPGDGGVYEVTFDMVARDRMGQPLVVANLDDAREPVGELAMAELVEAAGDVSRSDDSLAAAFGVATSYFDADALATVREATGGSLLSRDRRESFVKLSRKRGFHLCLVEDRGHTFDLAVPDL